MGPGTVVGAVIDRKHVEDSLLAMGIPPTLITEFPDIGPEVEGILIYGSRARGDAIPGSDLDVIALVDASKPSRHSGDVNVSYYTGEQLTSGIGTLFGVHLKRDSKIVWENAGKLTQALGDMGDVDTDRLMARVRDMSTLFVSPAWDLPKYLPGLLRQARYLLRSSLYGQTIANGDPCFSVRELAVQHSDPSLATLLASNQSGEPSLQDLDDCLSRLRNIVGDFPGNEHGSLEASIVNMWGQRSDVLSMAFLALGATTDGADYAEVEKILL